MKRIFGKLLLCFVVAMAMMSAGAVAQEAFRGCYKTPMYYPGNCRLAAEDGLVILKGSDSSYAIATSKEAALAVVSAAIGQIQRGENGDWVELAGRKWMLLKNNGNPLSLVSCGEKGMASLDCRCLQDMEDWLMGKTPEERGAEEEEIFLFTEVPPIFGDSTDGRKDFIDAANGWKHYIEAHVRMQADVSGTVYVQVVIEKDGSIGSAKVLRGLSCEADTEAMRVVASMPKWSPARQRGRVVRSQYTLVAKF